MNVTEVVGPSVRLMNRAKRKAKQALVRQRSDNSTSQELAPELKKIKLEHRSTDNLPIESLPVPDNTGYWPPEVN